MNSIRVRLTVFLLASALLTALIIGAITYRHNMHASEKLFDEQLQQIAQSLRDQGAVANSLVPDGVGEPALGVAVQIWTNDGAVLYVSQPTYFLPDRAVLGFTNVDAGNKRWRVYSMAAHDRIIQVALPLELRSDRAAAAAIRSLAPLLTFAPIMALLISWLVINSLAPLKRVTSEVSLRDARLLDPVAEDGVPSEIMPLIRSLNSLLERLKKAFSRQSAFVADAAHELRSPMTALKLQLQLLDRATSEADRANALEKLHEGADRASHLIEQLIAAARSDPNDTSLAFQPVDLAELVRQVIAEIFVFAQARAITVELDAPEQLMLPADQIGLRMLVRNLLDNAIRYTPQQGAVRVSLSMQEQGLTLVVEDSGPGIPEAERARAFERFYRCEPNEQIGSGLGLSIVKNIAEQHGAQLELGTSQLGGLKVTVRFSREPAGPVAASIIGPA